MAPPSSSSSSRRPTSQPSAPAPPSTTMPATPRRFTIPLPPLHTHRRRRSVATPSAYHDIPPTAPTASDGPYNWDNGGALHLFLNRDGGGTAISSSPPIICPHSPSQSDASAVQSTLVATGDCRPSPPAAKNHLESRNSSKERGSLSPPQTPSPPRSPSAAPAPAPPQYGTTSPWTTSDPSSPGT